MKEAELWRQGLYILDALNVSIHNNVNLSGKPIQQLKYIEKPFDIVGKSEAEKKLDEEKARREAVEGLHAWAAALGRKFNGNRDSKS